ncbi:MAG: two-component regulator propeller domain-containing protein [Saprospiraceae bacterium]
MMALFRLRVALLFGLASLALVGLLAQYSSSPIFHGLTTKEGLSQSTNAFINQDSYGFVWISSLDGVNRYDGRRVSVYNSDLNTPNSLYGANIQSNFFEDGRGDLWFSTDMGINRYRRQTGDFDHYFVQHDQRVYKDTAYHAIYLDSATSQLWVNAADAIFKFDTKSKKSIFVCPTIGKRFGVQQDRRKAVIRLLSCFWLVRQGMEILEFDNQGKQTNQTVLFQKPGQPAPYTLTIRQCFVENDSICWYATDKGLLYLNSNNPKQYRLHTLPGTSNSEIHSICPQLGHRILVSSINRNIWKFDLHKKEFLNEEPILSKEKEVVKNVRDVYFAPDSSLWCSVRGEGLYYSRLREKKIQNPISSTKEFKLKVTQIFENDGAHIWCLSEYGQTLIFKNNQTKNLSQILRFPQFTTLYRFGDNLIGLSKEGISRYAPSGIKERDLMAGLSKSQPVCLVNLSENEYYLGTFGGLKYLKLSDESYFDVPFVSNGVFCLFIDNNKQIWLYGNNEINVWEMISPLIQKSVRTFSNTGSVNQIVGDPISGNILVAGSSGLRIIDPNTFKDTLITEKEGLPDQYIYAVVPDKNKNLWLSSNQGIIKFMPYKPVGQQFKQYTTRNGLSSNEYCPGSALMSSSTGEIWFGSTKGVDVFHPDSITDNSTPPKLAIVGLKIHDQEWQDSTTCIEMAERIVLEHYENNLRFDLAAMEYTDPEMNKFRVWLSKDGGKPDTVDLGTQNFITYANLRPGKYVFQFTACNSEGIWQEIPRQLEIIIDPHFTDTWQFKAFIALLALAFIGFSTAFYYRYRLRLQQLALEKQQREAERKQLLLEKELSLQEERNRIADEMHDELGGGLSTIRLASQRAKKVEAPEELQTILKRVSQISIGLVNNMRGIIWAMDSQNDSLLSLLAYIRQYAGTFLDDNAISATLSIPTEFPDRTLSSQFRHNVMLTVKECLNNILKHADASAVKLQISVDNQLHITIQDNGKGFEPVEHAGMGKGLRTTVKRMESVGGSIEWQRNAEGGMTVILLAPLP